MSAERSALAVTTFRCDRPHPAHEGTVTTPLEYGESVQDHEAVSATSETPELYDGLMTLMRQRVSVISARLQVLSAEMDIADLDPGLRSDRPEEIDMERIVDTFTARDAAGNEHRIEVVRGFHATGVTSDSGTFAPDMLLELRTTDGRHVNRIAQGTYQIIAGLDVTPVWCSDPQAP